MNLFILKVLLETTILKSISEEKFIELLKYILSKKIKYLIKK